MSFVIIALKTICYHHAKYSAYIASQECNKEPPDKCCDGATMHKEILVQLEFARNERNHLYVNQYENIQSFALG